MSIGRIESGLHDWPREQAAQQGVGLDNEVRSLLPAARDVAAKRRGEQARWEAVFAQSVKPPSGTPGSMEAIRQMRDGR